MFDGIDPSAWLVLLGTIFGGVGLRYIDHWLTRRKTSLDEGAAWRREQREEISGLKGDKDQLEAEVIKWRDLYYDLREAYALLKVQLEIALARIRKEADDAGQILPDPRKLPHPEDDVDKQP
jgi:hypothetical protein